MPQPDCLHSGDSELSSDEDGSVTSPDVSQDLDTNDDDSDCEYDPTNPESDDSSDWSDDDNDSSNDSDESYDPVYDRKFLIFEHKLDKLLVRCQRCGSLIKKKTKATQGSLLIVTTICLKRHHTTWTSQPTVGRAAVGNILLSAAILISGCLLSTFQLFSSLLNFVVMGKTTYYKIQKRLLCPVINQTWMDHVGSVHLVATGEQLKFCGDGRSDSPGHSAKYCTYTLMESTSSLIFDLEIIHMSMAENSTTMEREGLRRILKRLGDAPFTIQQVATDRSPMIKTLMRREFSSISHQFDVWHFVKSVVKKLTKATRKKEMAILRKWIPSIANHLSWSASSCNGDSTQL